MIEELRIRRTERALLSFSGGLDSTYYLYRLLEEGYIVDTFYCESNQAELKIKKEIQTREKILLRFNKEYPRQLGVDTVKKLLIGEQWSPRFNRSFSLSQPVDWMICANSLLSENHSKVCIGYISGDCVMHHHFDMKQMWESMCRITFGYDHKPIPLEFGLIHTYKSTVYYSLIHNDLLNSTWTCEIPSERNGKIIPCMCCMPCKTISSMLVTDVHEPVFDSYYKAMGLTKKELNDWKNKTILPKPKEIKEVKRVRTN